ncbi:phage tail-collar fiber domain-containing protein [Enterobacter cloacae]|uniref:phage tail-collar fiber domain-containing protein n=1 Tax=Enterobacter cloacae TaxID=550 RepID=UPI0009B56979|nr:phage tail protein [Enterobacter cloacae]
MTVKFKTVITKAGAEKLAAATVPNGKKVNFTAMAVGDGGGALPVPDASQTKLVNEVWRHALNKISQDKKNKNYVVAELLIPPEVGGFWMREMGLYDDTGTLIAVGNMAESYKPALEEGSGRAQTLRMVIMVSDISSVELTIDTSTVMATQEYVDGKLAEHEQSRRHPDATLAAKGFTQLSSAIDSASEVLAATPKAVKAAYDLANGKYTAADATTARKGIVQLSSATDSVSEVLAATPKAVKAVNDDLNAVKKTLGTAAAADAATSDTDTMPKRLVPVGWMGLGAVSGVSFTDANQPNYNCYFRMNAQGLHGPVAGVPANIHQFQYDANAGQQIGYRAGVINAAMYHRSKVNAAWGNWLQVFDTEHPPTPEQVGAFPNSASLLNSIFDITSSNVYAAMGAGTSVPTSGMPENSGNTRFAVFATMVYAGQYWVTLISRDQNYTGLVNTASKSASWTQVFNTANKPTASDVDAVSASNGGTFKKEVSFQAGFNIRSSTGIYAGNDSAGFISNNLLLKSWYGIGFYCTLPDSEGVTGYINTRIGQLEMKGQVIPGNYSNFDGRYYTKMSADERYQLKGNYTPAGQAYTKAESDGRFQKINAASKAANGWFKDTNTGLIIQWGSGSSLNIAFSLPIAFPNACLSTQITDRGNGKKAFSGMASKTDLTVWGDASNPTYSWLAVGY